MRISDWSSDVCSSDLGTALEAEQSRNLPQAPSRRLRSAIRRPRHRLGPELTNIPQRPTCRDCPMPHSSWHPHSSGPIPKGFRQRPKGWEGAKRSEEHTSELQSLMRISYAVFCLKKKNKRTAKTQTKE